MSNTALWDSWRSVPNEAQKPIRGGRLNNMTDISPMWRYHVLTNTFGPCGKGWYFEIREKWQEPVGEEIHCQVMVALYYALDTGEWSKPVLGVGGNKLLSKERNGSYASDEGYKMALTDALSVCCKMLGIGADVYWGEGSKYTRNNGTPQPEEEPDAPPPPPCPPPPDTLSVEVRKEEIDKFQAQYSMEPADFKKFYDEFSSKGFISAKPSKDMTLEEFMDTMSRLHTYAEERKLLYQKDVT